MKWRAIIPALAMLLVPISVGRANTAPATKWIFDREADCSATPPAATSVSGVTDDGHRVKLEVAILLDGVKIDRARELVTKVASAYAPLGVELVVPLYRRIKIAPDAKASEGTRATIDGRRAIAHAHDFFGGTRPEGIDVVHVLTSKDITLPPYGSAAGGVAECAGGVQYDDKAFSVSEDGPDAYSYDVLGITNVMDAPAEAVAHEIGHLLGGLHEHKSCAEGVAPEDAANRDPSPCTIMSDVGDVASMRFGVLESAVIRGYALRFADS